MTTILILLIIILFGGCTEEKKNISNIEIKNNYSESSEPLDSKIEIVIEMFESINKSNCEKINELIKNGFSLNYRDSISEFTLLTYAIFNKHIESAKCLIENGVDVNLPTSLGMSPLMMAIQIKDLDFVKFMIDKGSEVNAIDVNGRSPLYFAIYMETIEIIRYLIQSKANVNMTFTLKKNSSDFEEEGVKKTLLQFAKDEGNKEIINLLVEAGAK